MKKPNIYFLISGRQTGKTSKAIYETLKNVDSTLFICNHKEDMFNIQRKCNNQILNICSCRV